MDCPDVRPTGARHDCKATELRQKIHTLTIELGWTKEDRPDLVLIGMKRSAVKAMYVASYANDPDTSEGFLEERTDDLLAHCRLLGYPLGLLAENRPYDVGFWTYKGIQATLGIVG